MLASTQLIIFGGTSSASGSDAVLPAPATGTLTLISGATDNTPDFTYDAADLAVNDTVRFQYSTDSGFAGASEVTNTIDAGEDAANELAFSTGSLADGTWYFRARTERTGHTNGAWSNTQTETIDTTAPTLSSPSGTQTGSTTASLTVSSNEGNGTLFVIVQAAASAAPSSAQIILGQNSSSAAAAFAANQAVSGTGTQTISGGATGLTASTAYKAHFAHRDTAGNVSSVSSSSSFTTASASGDVTTGLKSYWLMNEGSATTFADSVSGHDGTLNDNIFWSGDHLAFGAGNSGRVSDHADFAGDTITVCGWVRGAAVADGIVACQWDFGTAQRAWIVGSSGDGTKLVVTISDDGTTGSGHYKQYVSSITVFDGSWHLWSFRFNAGTLDLFVDGVKDTSVTKTTDGAITSIFNSNADIVFNDILNSGSTIGAGTNNQQKKVRLYNIAKADADVTAVNALGA